MCGYGNDDILVFLQQKNQDCDFTAFTFRGRYTIWTGEIQKMIISIKRFEDDDFDDSQCQYYDVYNYLVFLALTFNRFNFNAFITDK